MDEDLRDPPSRAFLAGNERPDVTIADREYLYGPGLEMPEEDRPLPRFIPAPCSFHIRTECLTLEIVQPLTVMDAPIFEGAL